MDPNGTIRVGKDSQGRNRRRGRKMMTQAASIKPWEHHSQFISTRDAGRLYRQMLSLPWSKCEDDGEAAIH